MSYLISQDYLKQIQDVSLQQIISGNDYFQRSAELTAIKQVTSYLRQKYDVDSEFTDTLLYSPGTIYKAANRVYLDAPAYNASSTYSLKDLVLQAGKVYQCSTAIPVAEAFNVAHWTELGDQYDLFFAAYPESLFNSNRFYQVGDKVFWKDKTYTALKPTVVYGHESELQYGNTNRIPSRNIFPDDPVDGRFYWADNGVYSVEADTLTNSEIWTKGDNRHPQLVMFTIDIAIYHLYSRIAPKNIPEARENRFNAAIAELRMMARGEIASDVQRVQPDKGNRIRWGSNVKQNNSY